MARPKREELHPRILHFRQLAALTQEQLAERVGISAEMVRRHERGLSMPIPLYRDRYCAALGTTLDQLWVGGPGTEQVYAPVSGQVLPADAVPYLTVPAHFEYGDDDYLTAIRQHIRSIVDLDNRFGGTDLVRLSTRFFRSAHAQLGAGKFQPHLERDLQAAIGELAEVTGWLAYDANDHELVRRMNQESLYFTRLAGDRSTEMLTLQNASMHAAAIGNLPEALSLARAGLQDSTRPLSSRLRSMFLIREGRALAGLGDRAGLRRLAEARSLFYDGIVASDPGWAWWIDERELHWQEAMALRDLGDHRAALDHFQASAAAGPSTGIRSQYIHHSYLLQAQVEAADWTDTEAATREIRALIPEIASTRTVVLLQSTMGTLDKMDTQVPRRLIDDFGQLKQTLLMAPV